MRLVASGHTKKTAVAAFMRAMDGRSALDMFQSGAILQADATHYDPMSGELLQLTGKRVVASVDGTLGGLTLNLASCSCGRVTASNEPVTHCVACGDTIAAEDQDTLEVENSEDTTVTPEGEQEEELALEGATEAATEDDSNAEASDDTGEPEEEESVDDGGWIEPGTPLDLPENKEEKKGEESSDAAPVEPVAQKPAEAAGDDEFAPDYSLHNKPNEDVSMNKKIKATASTKSRAASLFVRKLIAGLGNQAIAADNQILTASDVLSASCPKCQHITLSSEDFHDLPGGAVECGHCKHSITASHLGLTNLTVDRSHTKAADGEDEGEGDAPPASMGSDDAQEDDLPVAEDASGDGNVDDVSVEDEPAAEDASDDEEQTFPEDEFEEEEATEDGEPPADDEPPAAEGAEEDDGSWDEEPAPEPEADLPAAEGEGDGAVVDEFEATDGDADAPPEPMEEIDLLESTDVEDGDEVEVAYSSAVNRAPRWDLSIAGCVIASLKQDFVKGPLRSLAADSFSKQKFAVAVRTALGSNVTKNAKALGFSGVKIHSPLGNHVKAKVEAATAANNAALAAQKKALASQVREALVVVAAGLNRGFFRAVAHPMRASVFTALSNARVQGAARIANAAFADKGEAYAEALVTLAFEHLAKPAEARSEIAKSILGMGYQAIAEDGAEEEEAGEPGEMPSGTSVPDEEFMDRLEQGFDTAGDHGTKTVVAGDKSDLKARIRGLKFRTR